MPPKKGTRAKSSDETPTRASAHIADKRAAERKADEARAAEEKAVEKKASTRSNAGKRGKRDSDDAQNDEGSQPAKKARGGKVARKTKDDGGTRKKTLNAASRGSRPRKGKGAGTARKPKSTDDHETDEGAPLGKALKDAIEGSANKNGPEKPASTTGHEAQQGNDGDRVEPANPPEKHSKGTQTETPSQESLAEELKQCKSHRDSLRQQLDDVREELMTRKQELEDTGKELEQLQREVKEAGRKGTEIPGPPREPMGRPDGSTLPTGDNRTPDSGEFRFIPTDPDDALKRKWALDFVERIFHSRSLSPRHLQRRNETGKIETITSPRMHTHENVVSVIGSLWATLLGEGQIHLAFGTPFDFQWGRQSNPDAGVECRGRGNTFIIPLYIDSTDVNGVEFDGTPVDGVAISETEKEARKRKNKEQAKKKQDKPESAAEKKKEAEEKKRKDYEKTGHLLLVVATRDTSHRVRLTYYDSGPRYMREDQRRLAVRNIIQNTKWALPDKLTWGEEEFRPVPHQDFDTCGTHTILNAWAVMLGLQLSPEIEMSPTIYRLAIDLFNLALQGQATVGAVRAFLMSTGWCTRLDLGQTARPYDHAQCVAMNVRTLEQVFEAHMAIMAPQSGNYGDYQSSPDE